MCGRYLITSAPEAFRRLFRYREQPNFPPRYNVAPTQPVPIVRVVEGERQFALVRWGLIPAWVKDPRAFSLLINARAESVNDKPAFKNAMKRRRCLILADGFYEWKTEGTRKRPYVARPKEGGPIAFVRTGDKITIDAEKNTLTMDVSEQELSTRRQAWKMPPFKANRGTLAKYIRVVKNASLGCVTDE